MTWWLDFYSHFHFAWLLVPGVLFGEMISMQFDNIELDNIARTLVFNALSNGSSLGDRHLINIE